MSQSIGSWVSHHVRYALCISSHALCSSSIALCVSSKAAMVSSERWQTHPRMVYSRSIRLSPFLYCVYIIARICDPVNSFFKFFLIDIFLTKSAARSFARANRTYVRQRGRPAAIDELMFVLLVKEKGFMQPF